MTVISDHGILATFLRWTQRLSIATEWISAFLLGAIIAINFAAIVARYVFSDPIGWSEEAMRYGIVWATYLVAGATFRRGEQMAVDLVDMLPSLMLRKAATIVSLISTLSLAAVVVTLGLPFLANTGQVSPSMQLPMWIPYASVVVGYIFIAIQAIAAFLQPSPSRSTYLEEHDL